MESLTKIATKLYFTEKELCLVKEKWTKCKEQIKNKDEIIAELNKKLEDNNSTSMQKFASMSRKNDQLENRCKKLQKKLTEMEKFLADYGLKWVGENKSEHNRTESSVSNCENNNTSAPTHDLNFETLMKNIATLNELAGDGEMHITHTSNGATFKNPKRIPLTFYANGFVISSGHFCEYSEPRAQQFVTDIMDGYFPSEFQFIYPNGVILEVNDKHCHFYENEKEIWKPFTGKGFRLGSTKEQTNSTEKP